MLFLHFVIKLQGSNSYIVHSRTPEGSTEYNGPKHLGLHGGAAGVYSKGPHVHLNTPNDDDTAEKDKICEILKFVNCPEDEIDQAYVNLLFRLS